MLIGVVRIIFTCIVSIFGIILMYTSFFMSEEEPYIQDINSLAAYDTPAMTASGFISSFKNISLFESIFSDQKEIVFQETGSGIVFDISLSGKYFSSLRDIRKNYVFEGKNIKIQQTGVGEIYFQVDTQKQSIFVFPLNTSVEIELLDDSNQQVTKIFLTPHMYAEIDTTKIPRLKNADALRVQTLFRIGYVALSLSELYDAHILDAYGLEKQSFFSQVLEHIGETDTKLKHLLAPFKNQQVIEIFGNSVLQKYGSLFVNAEKKEVYHKNEILRGYIELLSLQRYDSEKVKALEEHMKKLSDFDTEAYTQMYELSEKIRFFLASGYEKDTLFAKMLFSELLYPDFDEDTGYYAFYAQSLFRGYDTTGEFSPELSQRFLQSFILYSQKNPQDQKLLSQYFLFFLERQLNFFLTSSLESDVIAIIDTLKNYIDISETLIDKNSPTARFTSIYIYDEILKNIDIFLRGKYFKELRNEQNLLELSDLKISSKDVATFKIQIERIFALYESFAQNLGEQDIRGQQISKDIANSRGQITQYFLALENYQSYVTQYTIAGNEIFETQNDGTKNDLTIEKAKEFLSGFQGVDVSRANIEIIDGYYNIKNLYISGKLFEFHLYSYSSLYKIKNIYIDGIEQRFMYNIEQDTNPLSEKDTKSEFFLDTFFTGSDIHQNQEYVVEENKAQEDKDIIVLKRDILLGESGHFKILEDTLLIQYENISAYKKDDGYDISLKDVPLKNIAGATLDAQFLLLDGKKYFQNTSIHFTDLQTSIQVPAKVLLHSIPELLKNIESLILGLQSISQTVSSKYQIEKSTLTYSQITKKITFKFDSSGKKYTITQIGDSIDRFYIGTQNMLTSPIKITQLSQYLP